MPTTSSSAHQRCARTRRSSDSVTMSRADDTSDDALLRALGVTARGEREVAKEVIRDAALAAAAREAAAAAAHGRRAGGAVNTTDLADDAPNDVTAGAAGAGREDGDDGDVARGGGLGGARAGGGACPGTLALDLKPESLSHNP